MKFDLVITRTQENEFGTLSEASLIHKNKECIFNCIERPWMDDLPSMSRIKEGFYIGTFYKNLIYLYDPKEEYLTLTNQSYSKRWGVRLEVANYPTDLEGCIGVGAEPGVEDYGKIPHVVNSRATLERIYKFIETEAGKPITALEGEKLFSVTIRTDI